MRHEHLPPLAPEAEARLRSGLSLSLEAPASHRAAGLGSTPRSGFPRGARVSHWGSRLLCAAGPTPQGWHGMGGSQNASGIAPLAARSAVLRSPSLRRPSLVVARPHPPEAGSFEGDVEQPM
ncbi:hypothetical protein NDU88_001703 [Pleurodeles waltl]|uniref:Uncharacterized protein n=1 Tax=Pleurodeles waltl TaxID=8319 RepID=A0AAV7LA92_PLEWA|nr:hypothetical protein NDU88_001703 [Pleurodeles waltl]